MQGTKILTIGLLVGFFMGGLGTVTRAEEPVAQVKQVSSADILKVIREDIKNRSIKSGTLDVYDETINKVRNLRTMKFPETVTDKDGMSTATIEYRDIKSGDLVTMEAIVDGKKTPLAVKELKIQQVKKLKEEKAGAEKKEFSDADIQAFMKDYLDQQVKFTGSLMLFDEERNKMRTLKLVKLDTVVKRLGIFFISRAEFKDEENGDTLDVDVSVENKEGELAVQALRIRDVCKTPKP
jgi:hypothetical protein